MNYQNTLRKIRRGCFVRSCSRISKRYEDSKAQSLAAGMQGSQNGESSCECLDF